MKNRFAIIFLFATIISSCSKYELKEISSATKLKKLKNPFNILFKIGVILCGVGCMNTAVSNAQSTVHSNAVLVDTLGLDTDQGLANTIVQETYWNGFILKKTQEIEKGIYFKRLNGFHYAMNGVEAEVSSSFLFNEKKVELEKQLNEKVVPVLMAKGIPRDKIPVFSFEDFSEDQTDEENSAPIDYFIERDTCTFYLYLYDLDIYEPYEIQIPVKELIHYFKDIRAWSYAERRKSLPSFRNVFPIYVELHSVETGDASTYVDLYNPETAEILSFSFNNWAFQEKDIYQFVDEAMEKGLSDVSTYVALMKWAPVKEFEYRGADEGNVETGNFYETLVLDQISSFYPELEVNLEPLELEVTKDTRKKDILSSNVGTFVLERIDAAYGMNDYSNVKIGAEGQWEKYTFSYPEVQQSRHLNILTAEEIAFIQSLQILVNDSLNVRLRLNSTVEYNIPFSERSMKFDVKTSLSEQEDFTDSIGPKTIFQDQYMYLLASEEMEMEKIIPVSLGLLTDDIVVLKYDMLNDRYILEISIFECCAKNTYYFKRKV